MARFQHPLSFDPFQIVALKRASTRDFRAEMRKRGLAFCRDAGQRGIFTDKLESATRIALEAFKIADVSLSRKLGRFA